MRQCTEDITAVLITLAELLALPTKVPYTSIERKVVTIQAAQGTELMSNAVLSCYISNALYEYCDICCIDVFPFLIVVDCGTLNATTNGQVSYTAGTTYQQTATYSCDTGYNLVGDSIRTCQADGTWFGSAPTCQSMLLLSTPECMYKEPRS